MTKGQIFHPECRRFCDEHTGMPVVQWTSHASLHHHPFFYVPAYSGDGSRIVFVSHRSGRAELYAVKRASGQIIQLTERDGISEWSLHPAWESGFVLYIAGQTGYRLELSTLRETTVVEFAAAEGMRGAGMVGAGMGVTALSWCDRYWAVRVNVADGAGLVVVDLETGHSEMILCRDEIGHISFCPDDAGLLFAARSMKDRVWVVRRNGSGHRRLYRRQPGEWVTHETWIPGTCELAFVDWPKGIRAVNANTGRVRPVAGFNAWHAVCNRQGTLMVADTNLPDIGLQVFDPRAEAGKPMTLCHPRASNAGTHWGGPFPYENGPIKVHAPQDTHPHPSFSPDGRHVVFTSDCSGHAQIYEVAVPEQMTAHS